MFEQNQAKHVRHMVADGKTDARKDETQPVSPHFGPSPTGVEKKTAREHGGKMFVVVSGMKGVIIPPGKRWEGHWMCLPTQTPKIPAVLHVQESV